MQNNRITQKVNIKALNSFGIDVCTAFFAYFNDENDLREILKNAPEKVLVIGGGSNMLFLSDYDGIILKSSNETIKVTHEDGKDVLVEVGAGVVWDDFCIWAVENNLYGIENLSYIPGSVGASPVQNVGAYGVEAKDVIEKVNYYSIKDGEKREISGSDCNFGYRDSIFKQSLKGDSVVLSVVFHLSKVEKYNLEYGTLKAMVEQMGEINLQSVRTAVIETRCQKLPDPKIIGNGGSFFKNPVVEKELFENLRQQFPTITSYKSGDKIKIPAAWLIEQCGFKGTRVGNAGVYDKQALVLVNHGGATGNDILNLSKDIIKSVEEKFGITLQYEINII